MDENGIRQYKAKRDRVDAALEGSPAQMRTQTRQINITPGAVPQVIRLTAGYVSTIIFQDNTGAPWTLAIASHRRKAIGTITDLSEEERAAVEISTKADELFWAIKTEAILPAKHFTSEDTDGSEITRLLTDDPSALATALAGIAIEQPHLYQQRAKVIGNLRVIYQPDRIGELIPRFSDMGFV